MPSDDEFDAIADDFDGFDFDAIPDLATLPPSQILIDDVSDIPPRPLSATSSTDYSCDDGIDDSLLAEIDAIESRLNQGTSESTETRPTNTLGTLTTQDECDQHSDPSGPIVLSRFFGLPIEAPARNPQQPPGPPAAPPPKVPSRGKSVDADFPPRTTYKRERDSSSTAVDVSAKKKGKGKANAKSESNEGVRQVLEGFEDEMTCPICCDIFVAAHLGNPCGHSFCGECGWEWISKNKRTPTCAVCRAKLTVAAPMIPNFALDNTVGRHILALASSGQEDWQTGGSRISEWNKRKEQWKRDSANRAAEAAPKSRTRVRRQTRTTTHIVNFDDEADMAAWIAPDNEVEFQDDSYDEAEELIYPDIHARLRPRRSRGLA